MSTDIPIPVSSFGIDVPEDQLVLDLQRADFSSTDPAKIAKNLESLANMVEQIHITTRDNNAIMFQMLNSVEERVNRRIDMLRSEMVAMIDQKMENFTAMHMQNIRDLEDRLATASASHGNNHSVNSAAARGRLPPGKRASIVSANGSVSGSVAGDVTDSRSVSVMHQEDDLVNNATYYERITATPNAGFVIKTRKLLGNKEKVFINVLHHESIDLEPPNLARNFTADNKPFLVMGEITHSLDKEGHNCTTYNVGVSSEYFKVRDSSEHDLKITSGQAVTKIIHKINLKYSEFLDESSFSLPKVSNGYVGDSIAVMSIPVPVKMPPPRPAGNGVASRNPSITYGQQAVPRTSFTNGILPSQPEGTVRRTSFGEVSVDNDSGSVVSELTTDNVSHFGGSNNNSGHQIRRPSASQMSATGNLLASGQPRPPRKVQRKSVFEVSVGRKLINAAMLEYIKEECIETEAADALLMRSVEDPFVLMGWQVDLKEGDHRGIYVITDIKKNMMSKTEFRLSAASTEDLWVKLKRAEGKSGLEFRPLRKVMFALGGGDDDAENFA